VIVGDANLCEVATYLKVGTTAIMLGMIEDGFIDRDFTLTSPVKAIRAVSHDPSLQGTLELASDGSRMTAVEFQWEFLDRAKKYAEAYGLEYCGGDDVGRDVLRRWEEILTDLETASKTGDFTALDGRLDWVTKHRIMQGYVDRDNLRWDDPKLKVIDLQYADVRPEKSLYEKLVRNGTVERVVSEDDVTRAMTEPPDTTRAYFRGSCLAKWPDSVVAANWDSIILDVGEDPLRRIPMLEPTKGNRAMVEALLARSNTPRDLVQELGA
jgi:proteasome accessory factor A